MPRPMAMPGTVSGAKQQGHHRAAAAEAGAGQRDAGGDAGEQAEADGHAGGDQAGAQRVAELGQDAGVPTQRVAGRREGDDGLVEHAQVKRQHQGDEHGRAAEHHEGGDAGALGAFA